MLRVPQTEHHRCMRAKLARHIRILCGVPDIDVYMTSYSACARSMTALVGQYTMNHTLIENVVRYTRGSCYIGLRYRMGRPTMIRVHGPNLSDS